MAKQPARPPLKGQSVQNNPAMERQINGLLQSMYGSVENEAIPERFLDLLEKLDEAERNQTASKQP